MNALTAAGFAEQSGMDQLRAMRVFARVANEGSFAAASRALDLAPAVVTRVVAELEEHLGARLMNRTTRRLALTEVGEDYLLRVRQILADVDEAEVLVGNATSQPRGQHRCWCRRRWRCTSWPSTSSASTNVARR